MAAHNRAPRAPARVSAWLALAAAASIGASAFDAGRLPASDAGVTPTTITLGIPGITHSFSGDEENLGFRLAFREANAGGGVHGRAIAWEGRDLAPTDGEAALLAEARRLLDEVGVFALVNWGGPVAIPLADLAAARKAPYLFPHSALVSSEGRRYLFTSFPRYEGEAALMFPYLARERRLTRLAIVHDANVYGRLFLDRLHALAAEGGYRVVGSVAVQEREPRDLTAGLRTLAESGADAIVLALYPPQARAAVAAKRALGWQGRLVTVGPLTDEQYLHSPDGVADGALGFCYYPDPEDSALPGVAAYRDQMARHHPGHALNRYSLYGYTFGRLIVEGLRRAGRELSRERLVDALESIADWDSGGVMPPVTLSAANHHAQRAGFICELERGRFRARSGWLEPRASQR